jgi:DNA processing protein
LSNGTNNLIKQGAKLVNTYQDILEELPIVIKEETTNNEEINPKQFSLSEEDKIIYEIINTKPIYINEIIKTSKLPPSKVSEVLLNLELKDLIKEIEGKKYIKR